MDYKQFTILRVSCVWVVIFVTKSRKIQNFVFFDVFCIINENIIILKPPEKKSRISKYMHKNIWDCQKISAPSNALIWKIHPHSQKCIFIHVKWSLYMIKYTLYHFMSFLCVGFYMCPKNKKDESFWCVFGNFRIKIKNIIILKTPEKKLHILKISAQKNQRLSNIFRPIRCI